MSSVRVKGGRIVKVLIDKFLRVKLIVGNGWRFLAVIEYVTFFHCPWNRGALLDLQVAILIIDWLLFYILETNQLLEITEANSEFVNSVGNEKVLLQPAISDVQCAVLTDVLENQIPKSTSKCFAWFWRS